MNDFNCIDFAKDYLSSQGVEYLPPGHIGQREPQRVEVVFQAPDTLDPDVAVVDPPDIRVWVSLNNGSAELIPQM